MRSTLKIGLIAFIVRARPAVPLHLNIGLCVFGFAVSPLTNATEFGRLFFTPEQRKQLDYAYAGTTAGGQESSSVLVINGIVQKQGGPRTVWINGVARNAERSGDSTPESQTITVPGKTFPVKAKVGQKILLDQPAPADEKK